MAKALVLSAALAASLAGCSPFGGGAFSCERDEQCGAGGTCQAATGYCSFGDSSCSSGQRYGDHAGNSSGKCVGEDGGGGGDGGVPPDMAQQVCYGATDGLVRPCFPMAPTGDLMLAGNIDTGTSNLCSTTVTGADGMCVIAGNYIGIEEGVAVTGSKPLVLVGVSSIAISATLDVASRRGVKVGPGANAAACVAGTTPGASGGGAGGSFGGKGGNGGNNTGSTAPNATTQPVTALRGGCRGGDGASGTPGAGGEGGGAVYLIAGTSIVISGTVNASGAGGSPGVTGAAGGGGGGSGGMIVFDAPTLENTGFVYANGASGGEGSGATTAGNPGPEPNSINSSPRPSGNSNGGEGGAGGGVGSPSNGRNGENGQNASGFGGGGGGGGVGVIRVFGGGTLSGMHSPAPS